ncbi:hypothetical protein MPLA_450010 [Mesorhizobium sp. ORS 3359]|nr:hypothetical protein MPLA_450010 [Mesorhizobium sp. ORS 3359]
MADHREPERAAIHATHRLRRRVRTRNGGRPSRPLATELPSEEVAEAPWGLAAGVEEQGAVEMIAMRAAVIAVGGSFSRGHSHSAGSVPS